MTKRPTTQAEMETWLHNGWVWLETPAHADSPKYAKAEESWFRMLREYEQAYRLARTTPRLPDNTHIA